MSIDFGQSTGINFSLSDEQKKVQLAARDFAENVLAPVVREADREPDPLKAFQMTKPAYVEAYNRGIAFCMLPKEYGGGGVSNVELIIAAEEICAVDPGFACTVLVNGLALLPVWYWGTEEQKRRGIGAAPSDPSGGVIARHPPGEAPGAPRRPIRRASSSPATPRVSLRGRPAAPRTSTRRWPTRSASA